MQPKTKFSVHLSILPRSPGVYIMKGKEGEILYIGKAKVLFDRVQQYFKKDQDTRAMVPFLLSSLESIETIVTFTEKEALILESNLIKKHKPKYNVLLKDDKSFISLMINHKDPWPKLELIRHRKHALKGALVFGPYTSALFARGVVDVMKKLFPLRQCSDRELYSRKRPCILYSMKRCLAPCTNKCTKEEYTLVVKEAITFLKGKYKELLKKCYADMEKASNHLQYEKAGSLLKTIRGIESLMEHENTSVEIEADDTDAFHYQRRDNFILIVKLHIREKKVIALDHFDIALHPGSLNEIFASFLMQHYSQVKAPLEILLPIELEDAPLLEEILETKIVHPKKGEKKRALDLAEANAKALLEQDQRSLASERELLLLLQEELKLSRFPSHIECFDTSNMHGKDAVAALVCYMDGLKDNKRSRLYKIEHESASDTALMEEVLLRRLTRGKNENDLPDLIILDGGKPQLSSYLKICTLLDIATIDVIAFTKEESRHDKGLSQEHIYLPGKKESLSLNPHSSLHFFLQNIRDEAHRRAITYHRKKRGLRTIHSALDDIPGIGKIKKRTLLRHFGSLRRIKEASYEELKQIPSLNSKDIETLLSFFKS